MLRVEDEPQILIMSNDDPREAWDNEAELWYKNGQQ